MPVTTSHRLFHLALLLQRLAFGAFILHTGIGKFQGGLDHFVHGFYASMTPAFVPHVIATPYGYAIPFLEVITGALLILGLFARSVSVIQLLMVVTFTIALAASGANIASLITNTNYLAILFLLALTGPGRYSLDRLWRNRAR